MKPPVNKVSNYQGNAPAKGPSAVSLYIAIAIELGAGAALYIHHFRPFYSVLRDTDVWPALFICGGSICYILWWLAAAEEEKPITKSRSGTVNK